MACPGRETVCNLWTSRARNGLKFFPYTYIPYVGLYSEDGLILRGSQGGATRRPTPIPANTVSVPKVCCGQLGI